MLSSMQDPNKPLPSAQPLAIWLKQPQQQSVLEVVYPYIGEPLNLPLFLSAVSAGFPSPAEDYLEKSLDLNEHIIRHPAATFFVRVKGSSMINAGLHDGDLLVVDRSLEARAGNIVVCVVEGDFCVKRLQQEGSQWVLMPENKDFKPIHITSELECQIWGVVAYVVHKT